jgi:hypothetical protein
VGGSEWVIGLWFMLMSCWYKYTKEAVLIDQGTRKYETKDSQSGSSLFHPMLEQLRNNMEIEYKNDFKMMFLFLIIAVVRGVDSGRYD